MQDDADETIARIAAALRPLPDVDPAQKARVLVAVAAERERERLKGARKVRALRWIRVGAGGALLAAGLVGAVWLRGARDVRRAQPAVASIASRPTPSVLAPVTSNDSPARTHLTARAADGVALTPVQLVLRAPAARRVSVVGDFNGWDASASAMTRDAASGLWSQTLTLRPGRHVYAFVVDDSIWIRDPRTPAANDADFGRPGSVLLVGHP
ncbi:MAG: glycoside hydrolase family 13 domain protein [Gemmatimonadetes bacterium]|nr:glycoside hydrolase family 13 domain protein [Gemmatimonadota bacterium]